MNKIRYYRQEQGLQLRDLVEATGLSMGHLSHLENGNKEPSKAAMELIAEALKKTVPEVFYPGDDAVTTIKKEGGIGATGLQNDRRITSYANG